MERSVLVAPLSPVSFHTSVKPSSSSPRPAQLSMVACSPRKQKQAVSAPYFETVLKRKRPPMLDLTATTPTIPLWCGETNTTAGKEEDIVEEERIGFYSVYCKRGRRGAMEDRSIVSVENGRARKKAFFGIFDGHGGSMAAEYAATNLRKNIEAAIASRSGKLEGEYSMERAIRDGYIKTDEDFLKEGSKGGACCVTALISDGAVSVSNAGDCRAVLSSGGVAEALTCDHIPSQENELKRIEALGGYVDCCNGVWRIQGTLAVTRGIGDRYLKKWVLAEPETTTLQIKPEFEFLILASDGLWDKVTNQEAVDMVRPFCVGVEKTKTLSACKKLAELSCKRGCLDDISLIIIQLQNFM
ncbi:unnamed protein product [Cochlearia groenlandica]